MSTEFFEQVADALVGLVPPELGPPSTRLTSVNLKAWFDDEHHEHYEAQLLADGTLEVGFHAEHRSPERNEAVVARLLAQERAWRGRLGRATTAGAFLGMPRGAWRRVSEVVPAPRRFDVDAALDVAERLATYVEVLEPLRVERP